ELAGERMKLGLLLGDPEEEHDCFSDNTHNSHFYNAQGISNVYGGHYKRVDGTVLSVLSLSALVAEADASADQTLRAAVDTTLDKMSAMVAKAEGGEAYDQMIAPGNTSGNATVQAAIDALVDQTKALEAAHAALGMTTVEFEGSDSLDNPSSVFE
ncbi:MAG: imelysin family protein, partial [Rhodospirillaceae bacterium]